MEFYKANLLSIKLLKRPSRFMYFRLANASELWVLWFHISWRRSWLPQAAYQMGWDAAFRHIYMIGMSPDQLLEKYANVPARAAELPLERNTPIPAARYCPECKALLEDRSVYCDVCGTDTPLP